MKRIYLLSILFLNTLIAVSQTVLTSQGQIHWDKANELMKSAESKSDYLNVISEYEKVKVSSPGYPDTYYNLARLYLEIADQSQTAYFAKAARSLEKYASLNPNDYTSLELANTIQGNAKENGVNDVRINISSVSARTYRLGDVFTVKGKKGVICYLDENSLHGLAISVEETSGTYKEAVKWIALNFPEGWNMPTSSQMNLILKNIDDLAVSLVRNNCEFKENEYWTSTTSSTAIVGISFFGYRVIDNKGIEGRYPPGCYRYAADCHLEVRAIYEF